MKKYARLTNTKKQYKQVPRLLIYWVTVANPEGQKIPLYMRKSAYYPEDHEVYLPAAGTGESEMIVQLLAMDDGQTVLYECGHAYVSASWMKKMWPRMTNTIEQIEKRMFSEIDRRLS